MRLARVRVDSYCRIFDGTRVGKGFIPGSFMGAASHPNTKSSVADCGLTFFVGGKVVSEEGSLASLGYILSTSALLTPSMR